MDLFEKNLHALNRFPEEQEKITSCAADPAIEPVRTRTGETVPQVTAGNRKVFVHSRFDPVTEAARFTGEALKEGHDLYIVFGFGFGFHVEALLKQIQDSSGVLVIEKSPAMVRAAAENRDLSCIFSDERFVLMTDPGEEKISQVLSGRASARVSFITHRGSFQLEGDYYSAMLSVCRACLSAKEVNIATLAKFEKIWSGNIARNIEAVISLPGVSSLYGKFSGMAAVIVAAGPSLAESLDFIRSVKDRALIIAVDTALGILLRAGIEPHFCVAVDPQVINARYFEGIKADDTVLVGDPTVHPSVFHLHTGPAFITGIAFDLMKWIEKISGEKGEITHGGSVATNAYDLAVRMGCSPVILTGQDLSFTGGRAHARGSFMEEQVFLRTTRLFTAECHNRFQLSALPPVRMKGIRSAAVQTNSKMLIFMSWFTKHAVPGLINASADGILIPGVKHMPAWEIHIPVPERLPSDVIKDLVRSSVSGDSSSVRFRMEDKIRSMIFQLKELIPVLKRAAGDASELKKLFGNPGADHGKIAGILKRLDSADRKTESADEVRDMLSLVSQKAIHTINEGYDAGAFSGENEKQTVAERSFYLYNALFEGAVFCEKKLRLMLKILGK